MKTWLRKYGLLLFAVLWLLALPWVASAATESWTFSLASVDSAGVTHFYGTGVTTAVKQVLGESGVSSMVKIAGKTSDQTRGATYAVDISASNGIFKAKIKNLAADTGNTPYRDNSGTTLWFFVKTAEENTAAAWSQAAFVCVYPMTAVNGVTVEPRMFQTAPAKFLRAYALVSGVTPVERAEIEIETGFLPETYMPVWTVAEGSFDVVAGGVSTWTASSIGVWPGGEYAEYQAGNSLFVTGDGTAPTTTGKGKVYTVQQELAAEGREAKAMQFKSIAAQTVSYRILNRAPGK